MTKRQCAICAEPFNGFGNNPAPFPGEVCCNNCDDYFVTPVRIMYADPAQAKPLLRALCQVAVIGKLLARAREHHLS